MSLDDKHQLYLQADGEHAKVLVEAYRDKCLRKSVISEEKARETQAVVQKLPEPIRLVDDEGRQHNCRSMAELSWYEQVKFQVTFVEVFFISDNAGGLGVHVRLRKDIEPYEHAATQKNVNDLNILLNSRETKDDKKRQLEHEKKEKPKRDNEEKQRRENLTKKYGGTSSTTSNSGQGPNTGSRR